MSEQLELFGRLGRLTVIEAFGIYWELEGQFLRGRAHKYDRKRIEEILGGRHLESLTPYDVKAYRMARKAKNSRIRESTLNKEHARITRLINAFYEWRRTGTVKSYDFSGVELPRENPGEAVSKEDEKRYRRNVVITPAMFREWADFAHPRVRRIATIGILTLLRRRDVELLTSDALNRALDTISGVQSKTGLPYTIPAPVTVKIIFGTSAVRETREYICDFTNFRRYWQRACKDSGIYYWYRDLRRSGSTFLLEEGFDLKTIQNLLGHGSIRTTEGYLNPAPKLAKEGVRKIEEEFVTNVSAIDYKFAAN